MVCVISDGLWEGFGHWMEACRCSLLLYGCGWVLGPGFGGFWMVPIISYMLREGCSHLWWMFVGFSWLLWGA